MTLTEALADFVLSACVVAVICRFRPLQERYKDRFA